MKQQAHPLHRLARFCGIALIFFGLASVFAAQAFAADAVNGAVSYEVGHVASVTKVDEVNDADGPTTTYYTTLAAAVTAANTANTSEATRATITLLDDAPSASTLAITGYVTLNLNNYGITSTSTSCIIKISSGANFTLTDTSTVQTEHYVYYDSADAKYVVTETQPADGTAYDTFVGGYLTAAGTSISASTSSVYVNGGTFYMAGGTIAGNNVTYGTDRAGGVLVDASGIFNMSGGTITSNRGSIGGVLVYQSTFNMSGGSITHNYASDKGGGVHVSNATFNMSGSASITDNYVYAKGGGVNAAESSIFTMRADEDGNTPTISGNTIGLTDGLAGGLGGGVCAVNTTVTLTAGSIENNSATKGGGVYVSGSTSVAMSGGVTISSNTATNGGGLYLDGGTSLTMQADAAGDTPSVSDNIASGNGGGIYLVGASRVSSMTTEDTTTATLSGGTISGNTATQGGGVYLYAKDSTSESMPTGAVVTSYHASFTMAGGAISGNIASGNGGGLAMYGGTDGEAIFSMAGGSVSTNSASDLGSGVWFTGEASVTLSGAAVVSGIYLASGQTVTVSAALAGGAGIAVATQDTATEDSFVTVAAAGDAYTLSDTDLAAFSKADTSAAGELLLDATANEIQLGVVPVTADPDDDTTSGSDSDTTTDGSSGSTSSGSSSSGSSTGSTTVTTEVDVTDTTAQADGENSTTADTADSASAEDTAEDATEGDDTAEDEMLLAPEDEGAQGSTAGSAAGGDTGGDDTADATTGGAQPTDTDPQSEEPSTGGIPLPLAVGGAALGVAALGGGGWWYLVKYRKLVK